jgi:glycosyltransferase involved in cell wall biosynthesis
VLVIVPTAGFGGVERVSVDLMTHARERFDVRALFFARGPMEEEARGRGIPVDIATERTGFEPIWGRARMLAARVRDARPDLIHVTGFAPLLETLVAGRTTRTPVVWHQQDPCFDTGVGAWKRFALVSALPPTATIFGTQVARDVIARKIPTLRRKRLITNGVVPPAEIPDGARTRRRLGLASHACLVTMISRLEPRKGPEVLVRAAPAIAAAVPDVQVVLAGPATDVQVLALRRLADDLGVREHVVFPGAIADDLKWGLLADSAVVAHPSRHEPFGLVIVEAMLAGTPVVAARSWGPEWIIRPGATGTLVEPGDSDELGASVVSLLRDPARARELAGAAQSEAQARFCFTHTVRATERAWRDACGRTSPAISLVSA